MSASSTTVRGPSGLLTRLSGQVLKLVGLAIGDALAMMLVYAFSQSDALALGIVVALVTIFLNVVVLVPDLFPLRWMSPGLALMTMFVVYPLIFTVYIAFTNFSDGHLYSKEQAIELHGQRTFVPEGAETYAWTAYVSASAEDELALWLTRELEDGTTEVLFVKVGEAPEVIDTDDPTAPDTYAGYRQLERRELGPLLGTLQDMAFGTEGEEIFVTARAASRAEQRYVYDTEQDAIVDRVEDVTYFADNDEGSWVSAEGEELLPGFIVRTGLENFQRFLDSPALRGPLVTVFIWTVTFSLLSVITTFALGLFMALVMSAPYIKGKKLIRSLLIIPYAVPGVISILAWQGMMNPNVGVLQSLGIAIPWFNDPGWAKVAVLLVNLWLGYPYMMLVCSGALTAIPSDIYEAAAVDGATEWQRFWRITLPLLLVTVGPLLIASFTYNFNNFVIIEALTEGGPPMSGTLIPVGHTDILISYTYEMAFGSGHGADYGLASAMTIIIFAIVAGVTLLQFRFTGQWEEVGENV